MLVDFEIVFKYEECFCLIFKKDIKITMIFIKIYSEKNSYFETGLRVLN